MSSRAVSADPKQVVAYAREFLRGLKMPEFWAAASIFPDWARPPSILITNSLGSKSPSKKCGTRISFPIASCGANCRWSWFRTPRFRQSPENAHPRFTFEEVDHRYPAQERSDIAALSAPTTWRWAACSRPLPSRRRSWSHSRGRRSGPDLPSGRTYTARA